MSTRQSKLIGTSIQRTDVLEKVLGVTLYSQDFWMEGMLYGGVLRSPYPSARIRALRTTAASQLPGVHAIMTAQDIPGQKVYGGPVYLDHPVLAEDIVRYAGQAVALVAAESRALVEQALRLIEVEYDLLPAVFDPAAALEPGASQIGAHGNSASHEWIHQGDLEQGFADADVIVEQTYHTTWIDHAPLEVECGAAWPNEGGGITLRVSTQSIEYYQQIAAVLALSPEKVRVICPMVGGGFGRKLDITVELYLALLAWGTQRPVCLASSREESIQAYSKRHPFTLYYKTGATKEGLLTAMYIRILADAGPFVYRSNLVSVHALMLAPGPYYVPNIAIDVQAVHTNNIFTSAMRAVGGPQVNFAYESQMDQLAARLGISPIMFRRLNYLRPGQALPNGQRLQDAIALDEATERVWQKLEEIPASEEVGARKRGRGISANFGGYGVPGNAASCTIEMQPDGHVLLSIGVCDLGGGQSSAVAQIAATVLDLVPENIILRLADTGTTPLVGPTAGSKTLYYCSHATFMAAQSLRKKLLEIAADLLEAAVEDLLLQGGEITVCDQQMKKVALQRVIEEARVRGIPLTEHATFYTPKEKKFDSVNGTGIDWPGFTFGVHAVEVAVDEDTGEVSILKYVCCHDVGRAIHPQSVVGQMHGGVAQGIGFTLMEQVTILKGIIQTPSLREYFIPTSLDVPNIATIVLESGEGLGAYANRGIGEPPAAATAGAVANAIYDAVGVRITELPMTPERIFAAVKTRRRYYEDHNR